MFGESEVDFFPKELGADVVHLAMAKHDVAKVAKKEADAEKETAA